MARRFLAEEENKFINRTDLADGKSDDLDRSTGMSDGMYESVAKFVGYDTFTNGLIVSGKLDFQLERNTNYNF